MSEEKIIKHTGQAARALLKRDVSWQKKIKEFLFEILIIVIAVSITLSFHNWNEHRHEKKLAKEFLIGIKEDLRITMETLDSNQVHYQHTLNYYDTIWKQISENRIDKKFMDDKSDNLTNMLGFAFDNSRFESFKASGNLRLIENPELLQDITRMFTLILPDREASDRIIFQERRNQYITYIGTKTPMGPNYNSLISGFINDLGIRFQIRWQGALLNEMKQQKIKVRDQIKVLIGKIEKELNK
jgi:hypothetical protein